MKTYRINKSQLEQIRTALSSASSDLWQLIRVSEYNLSGKDLNFPTDSANPVPEKPMLVSRVGIEESIKVHAIISEALKLTYEVED